MPVCYLPTYPVMLRRSILLSRIPSVGMVIQLYDTTYPFTKTCVALVLRWAGGSMNLCFYGSQSCRRSLQASYVPTYPLDRQCLGAQYIRIKQQVPQVSQSCQIALLSAPFPQAGSLSIRQSDVFAPSANQITHAQARGYHSRWDQAALPRYIHRL